MSLQQMLAQFGGGGGGGAGGGADLPVADTAETIQISSMALLKVSTIYPFCFQPSNTEQFCVPLVAFNACRSNVQPHARPFLPLLLAALFSHTLFLLFPPPDVKTRSFRYSYGSDGVDAG